MSICHWQVTFTFPFSLCYLSIIAIKFGYIFLVLSLIVASFELCVTFEEFFFVRL